MKKNIVYYHGKTQYFNTGDALINKSLIDFITQFGEVEINLKDAPDNYLKDLKIVSNRTVSKSYLSFVFQIIKGIIQNSKKYNQIYFISSPPGHQFGSGYKAFFKELIVAFSYFLLYCFKVKIIKIGFSLGPLDARLKLLERFKTNFMSSYLVRDQISYNYAKNLGIDKVDFFPDLAWTYDVLPKEDIKNGVFISFRDQIFTGANNEKYIEQLIFTLKNIIKSNFSKNRIVIGFQVSEDKQFCDKLFQLLKQEYNIEFISEQIFLSNAHIFSSFEYVLTNRLHVALLGFQYGCIPIILTDLNKHLKIKGIFEHADSRDLLIDISEPIHLINNKMDLIISSKRDIYEKLIIKEDNYYKSSLIKLKEIFND
ncbi:polysaccharide pyruvyl transferase family protein [Sphingobacterium sp. HJSM2_6]|uniref:polysaccharide pyruvyl transferase family protein n=1 Tax=Sphingobacterium sp. HJSM2_6 TaxID=3366264 RepID=UPI003BBCAC86